MRKIELLRLLFLLVTCTFFGLMQAQQSMTIKGKITSPQGEALPGVNIIIKGTTIGSITDIDGNYQLSVSDAENSVLVFRFVGYSEIEIPVKGQSEINVTMQESSIGLEEVVAIGYGVVKKRDLTGSVASISGQDIAAVPVANAAQALKGKLPGVNVISQDGRPDASISIRVRGGGSISQSNDPLFIVDGFPASSISDIPGSQIESIDVLKDASSTAIYGARGANGVIIVTTKSGKAGKLSVNYNGYVQFNTPAKYQKTMNAYDYLSYNWAYAKAISDTYSDAWEMLWAIGDYEDNYGNSEGIDHYKNVKAKNFAKEAYGDSFSHSHNLSISNGNDNTKYILSVNHINEDGMKVNSWYKRTNVSFKIDQKLHEKLTLSFDTRYTNINKVGDESTSNGRGSILSSAYWFRPIATEDVLGELDDTVNTSLGMYDTILQDMYNPVDRMKDYSNEARNRSLRANTSLSWNVLKGLTARSELGLNSYWNRTNTWSGAVYNAYYDSEGNKTFAGNATIESGEGWSFRWANTMNYEVQGMNSNHNLSLLLGQEVSDSDSESIKMWGNYYPASFTADRAFAMMDQYLASSTTTNSGYSSKKGTPSRLISYFGRVNYSLMDKYLFTGTFRADGSSRFAPTNRWGYFPAAALAWRVNEEPFLRDKTWIDNLKMRLSYGTVGNDGINADLWKMSWASDGLTKYSIDEEQQAAYSPASTTIANPDLKWETTITRNLGIDFGFFNHRLYGTLDLYRNSTEDLLMKTSVSTISGFSYTYENVGSTSNNGIELSLGTDIIRSADFNLSANINININKGKVEELAEGVSGLYKTQWGSSMTQPNTGDYILKEGQPVGLVRGYQYDGWYTVDDFNYSNGIYTLKDDVADIGSGIIGTVYGTNDMKPSGQSAAPGVIKFKDVHKDGIIDENDVDVIGNMNPKHTGGFNIQGNYKKIDFMLGFNWSYGNKVYNAQYLAAFYGSKEDGLYKNRLNYLSSSYKIFDIQNGDLTKVTDPEGLTALNAKATTFLPYHENPVVSTLGIQDGSFLRLNTVTVGYTLPQNISGKVGINKARIYGTIYNALVFTNYKGLDPEVNTNTNQGSAGYPTVGLDWGAYPRSRSFTFGINVEF